MGKFEDGKSVDNLSVSIFGPLYVLSLAQQGQSTVTVNESFFPIPEEDMWPCEYPPQSQ